MAKRPVGLGNLEFDPDVASRQNHPATNLFSWVGSNFWLMGYPKCRWQILRIWFGPQQQNLEKSEEFRIPTITKPSFSRPASLARQGSHLQVLEVMALGKIDGNYGWTSSPVHRNFSSTPLCLINRNLRAPDRWSNLFEEQKLHWFMHGQIPKCQVLQWLSCLAMATSHLVAWL